MWNDDGPRGGKGANRLGRYEAPMFEITNEQEGFKDGFKKEGRNPLRVPTLIGDFGSMN